MNLKNEIDIEKIKITRKDDFELVYLKEIVYDDYILLFITYAKDFINYYYKNIKHDMTKSAAKAELILNLDKFGISSNELERFLENQKESIIDYAIKELFKECKKDDFLSNPSTNLNVLEEIIRSNTKWLGKKSDLKLKEINKKYFCFYLINFSIHDFEILFNTLLRIIKILINCIFMHLKLKPTIDF